MSESRFLCTAANRQGIWPDPGMLGRGYMAFPDASAPEFRGGASIGGYYSIDDYHAALFLAHELADPNLVIDPDEALEKADLLHDLIQKVQRGGRITLEQLSALQKAAQSIPEIGPLMFSPTSLPGTMVTAGTLVAAASMSKPTHQLLDLTNARKKALQQWSRAKGKARVEGARKLAQGGVRLVTLGGKRYLEVPVTAKASRYLIGGMIPGSSTLLPVNATRASLTQRAMLNAQGARGALKLATGTIAGTVLAVVPQGIVDYTNSANLRDFLRRSTYSQPSNIAAVAASGMVAAFLTKGLVICFGISLPFIWPIIGGTLTGYLIQNWMEVEGYNKKFGDYIWGE